MENKVSSFGNAKEKHNYICSNPFERWGYKIKKPTIRTRFSFATPTAIPRTYPTHMVEQPAFSFPVYHDALPIQLALIPHLINALPFYSTESRKKKEKSQTYPQPMLKRKRPLLMYLHLLPLELLLLFADTLLKGLASRLIRNREAFLDQKED